MKKFIFAFTATMVVMVSNAYADIIVGITGNYAPFSIIKGIDNIHPDIMFTDTLEIAYQHSKNHKICKIAVKVDHNQYYKTFTLKIHHKARKLLKSLTTG